MLQSAFSSVGQTPSIKENHLTKTHCALVVTASLVTFAACGGSDKPPEQPSPPMTASAEAEAAVSADTSPPPVREENNDTEVSIDRPLTEACGLSDVKLYFPLDSAEVKNESEKKGDLRPLADCLTNGKLSGRALRVVGYADPRGTQEYNQDLGKSRAENIAELLKGAGVPETKLETKSEGESEASDDPSAWPRDRRVELYLVEN
jgi:outer membrane protein OmpA-like peptidoglycan-associated protein